MAGDPVKPPLPGDHVLRVVLTVDQAQAVLDSRRAGPTAEILAHPERMFVGPIVAAAERAHRLRLDDAEEWAKALVASAGSAKLYLPRGGSALLTMPGRDGGIESEVESPLALDSLAEVCRLGADAWRRRL